MKVFNNNELSFAECRERERTKHVHGIHPYKGKFIPQLVEYFLDTHTDNLKKEVYFHPGDIVLDPFCGSGTTLVQANELGLHAIGIDISLFSALISEVKVRKYDLVKVEKTALGLMLELKEFQRGRDNIAFEKCLSAEIEKFNHRHFAERDEVDVEWAKEREREFLDIYKGVVQEWGIKVEQGGGSKFLDIWLVLPVREEVDFLLEKVNRIEDEDIRDLFRIILSRTVRSCRATTHSDLATLKDVVMAPYYCLKHKKICKPVFSMLPKWEFYVEDTIKRLREFDRLRTDTFQLCLVGNSKDIDIERSVRARNSEFGDLLRKRGIRGIFTSPPYIGLIDYHDQHAYAYEMFGFERRDELEVGALFKGTGKRQQEVYVEEMVKVLLNCKKYLREGYDIFVVVNDKKVEWEKIAAGSELEIVDRYERPVLCRAEKNRNFLYTETIFHFRGNGG